MSSLPDYPAVPRVTVWVHGTHFWFNKLSKTIRGQDEGLHSAATVPENYLYRWLIADKLSKMNPTEFPLEHFHFFCWSGQLSFEQRQKAAERLAGDLAQLQSAYLKKYGVPPHITLITHSHGGNVALNIATQENKTAIDRLVLLAVPVQQRTVSYIHDPIFKKVYSFYSTHDFIQRGDPQGLYSETEEEKKVQQKKPLFSDRTFPATPSSLVQARVKFKGPGPFHVSYLFSTFLSCLDAMVKNMDAARERDCHHLSFKITKAAIIDMHDKKTST
jgi:pimeloyl-ACP methyl ester carboxylesterase